MRIAHVVTYVSTDGAFGGPVAVAAGQAAELAERGHEVDFIAGWDGKAELSIPGVDVHLIRARKILPAGFSGFVAPGLVKYLTRRDPGYDVVHIHLARDLITLPAANRAIAGHLRTIVQTHGMVMPDSRLRARLFDRFAMRSALGYSRAVLALTDVEEHGIDELSHGTAHIARIGNGVRLKADEVSHRDPDGPPEVLFLARLHPRKRVLAFAEMARLLIERGSPASFCIVGPDEGDLAPLRSFIAEHGLDDRVIYAGSLPPGRSVERYGQATVYVLPSVGEIVPMTVLEAMAAGTPVVLTDDCGLAPELSRRRAAIVTDGTPRQLADAVAELLEVPETWKEISSNARLALSESLGIGAVVDTLEKIYTLPDRSPAGRAAKAADVVRGS